MAGEFLGQDYLNAASSFGSSLGSNVLSTLSSGASTATSAASSLLSSSYNAGASSAGYLNTLNNQLSQPSSPVSTVKNTFSSVSALPSSFTSSLNMGSLTGGLSLNTPDVLSSFGNVGNNLTSMGGNFGNNLITGGGNTLNQLSNLTGGGINQLSGLANTGVNTLAGGGSSLQQTLQDQFNALSGGKQPSQMNNMQQSSQSLQPQQSTWDTLGNIVDDIGGTANRVFNAPIIPKASAADVMPNADIRYRDGSEFVVSQPAQKQNDIFGGVFSFFTNGGNKSSASQQKQQDYYTPSQITNTDTTSEEKNDVLAGLSNVVSGLIGGNKTESRDLPVAFKKKTNGETESYDQPITNNAVIIVDGKEVNNPKTSDGKTINYGTPISRVDEEYAKTNIRGYNSDIGDEPSRKLIGTEVTDTWTNKDGSPIKYKIDTIEQALEFKRQQSLAGVNPDLRNPDGTMKTSGARAAAFYQNEIDKSMQNRIRLSSDFHHKTSDLGISVKYNPWENAGDAALAFLKGGGRDNFGKNYEWNPNVVGPRGVSQLLPGGLGSQETAWNAAMASDPELSKRILSANFQPAIAAVLASDATSGTYTSLQGRSAPEDIIKLPKAYQDALSNIEKGVSNVDKAKWGGSFKIPDTFKIVPESKKGIVDYEDMTASERKSYDVRRDAEFQKKIDNAPEVDLYTPDGKGGERLVKGKVLVNEDTGEIQYYERHVDPSTGEYTSLYHPFGGGGENAAQSGRFQIGTPQLSNVITREGRKVDTSGFGIVPKGYAPKDQTFINDALERIYTADKTTDDGKNTISKYTTALNNVYGISPENTNALIEARKTGQISTFGMSPLNLANFAQSNAVGSKTSFPWTFPTGDTHEQGVTVDQMASSPLLITSNTGNVKRFSDYFKTPEITIPLSTSTKLFTGNVGEDVYVGGQIVRPAGYTGSSTKQISTSPYSIYRPGVAAEGASDITSEYNPNRPGAIELPNVKGTTIGSLFNLIRPEVIGAHQVTGNRGDNAFSYPKGSGISNLVVSPVNPLVGTVSDKGVDYNIYQTGKGNVAVPARYMAGYGTARGLATQDFYSRFENTPEGREAIARSNTAESPINIGFLERFNQMQGERYPAPYGSYPITDARKAAELTSSAIPSSQVLSIDLPVGQAINVDDKGPVGWLQNQTNAQGSRARGETGRPIEQFLRLQPSGAEASLRESTQPSTTVPITQSSSTVQPSPMVSPVTQSSSTSDIIGLPGNIIGKKVTGDVNALSTIYNIAGSGIESLAGTGKFSKSGESGFKFAPAQQISADKYDKGIASGFDALGSLIPKAGVLMKQSAWDAVAIPTNIGVGAVNFAGSGVESLAGTGAFSKSGESGFKYTPIKELPQFNVGQPIVDVFNAPLIPKASASDSTGTNIDVPQEVLATSNQKSTQPVSPQQSVVQPSLTQQSEKPNNWFFGMDLSKGGIGGGVSGIGTMISSTLNPQSDKKLAQVNALYAEQDKQISDKYIPIVNNMIGAGAKVTDSNGNILTHVNKDNVSGIHIEYNPDNISQNQLYTQLLSTKDDISKTDDKLQVAITDYKATSKDESANNAFGVTTGLAQKIIPEYEDWMGGIVDAPYQAGLKVKGYTDADIKAHYERPGNLTYTEQLKTFTGGEKGYTKDVRDPVTGLMTKQTYVAPEGVFRDVIVPFSKGFIDNPRDRPLEFITFAAMPAVFSGVGQVGSAGLSTMAKSSSPIISKIGTGLLESPTAHSFYQGVMGTAMANMVGQEGMRIFGQDFSLLNPLSGKDIYSDKLIEGYDKEGNPIYAEKSVSAASSRAGQFTSNMLGMGLVGNPTASKIKLFEESPTTQPSTRPFTETIKAKLTNLLDLPTVSNRKIVAQHGASEGVGVRPMYTKEIGVGDKRVDIIGPSPGGKSQLSTPASEIKPLPLETAMLMEADTTIANAALKATTSNGKVVAIAKGSPGTSAMASGEIAPGTQGGIRTAFHGLLKDLDIEAVNPVQYVKSIAKIASEDFKRAYADRGISGKVEVEPYYPDGYILGSKRLGQPVNPYNVEFKIKIDGVQQNGQSIKVDQIIPNSKIDLKLYGENSPRLSGEGTINFYNFVRTPNYEQTQPFIGLGTSLFGDPTMRGRAVDDFATTLSGSDRVKILGMNAAKNEKWNNIMNTVKTAERGGKRWNPEVDKLDKSVYDYVSMGKEQIHTIDGRITSGALKGKDLIRAQQAKSEIQNDIDNLLSWNIKVRKSPDAKIQEVNVGEMYKAKAVDIQVKVDAFSKPQRYDINLKQNAMQKPFVEGISATAMGGAGLTTLKLNDQSTMKEAQMSNRIGSSKPFSRGISLSTTKSLASESTIKPPSISSSKIRTGESGKPSSDTSKGSSSSGSPYGSSSSSVSSISSFSSYSGSSSSGSGSSSGSSSSQSSSSMSAPSNVSMSSAGFPFLAGPGGAAGGVGGGQGHGAIIVKNPLSALEVAGKSSKYFNFKGLNNYVRDVKGNTGTIPVNLKSVVGTPSGQEMSKYNPAGAISSVKEASSIARKSKKLQSKVKRSSKIEINGSLKIGNSKKKKGRYK